MNSGADASADVRWARERFLSTGFPAKGILRPTVLESWRRSQASGVHPERFDLPFISEPDGDSPLITAASPVLKQISEDLSAQAVSAILTSADGLVLQRVTSQPSIMTALDAVTLAPGYSYAEEFVGTNGIGTALETGKATFIRGEEHYVETLGPLACAGSPIRNPVTQAIVGVVDLTCWASQSDPLLFALAKSAGSQIEERMGALAHESETALLTAYLAEAGRFPLGVLAIGGDVVLMNEHLRQTLDAEDQIALVQHAAELLGSMVTRSVLAVLPSGNAVKIMAAERITGHAGRRSAVFHVHLAAYAPVRPTGTDPGGRLVVVDHDPLTILAEQQASLRRISTLVGHRIDPHELFSAVAEELARCLDVQHTTLLRYDHDGTAVLLAGHHEPEWMLVRVGERLSLDSETVAAMVFRDGRAGRLDNHARGAGAGAGYIDKLGIHSAVGAPIMVDGRLWGAAIVGSARPQPLPVDTEARLGDFVDLVTTALVNAETRAQLTASRARTVAAADDERRRLERDLHDGAQQRLIALALQLRIAETSVPTQLHPLKEQIARVATDLAGVSEDLREISHGIHPAILAKGLGPALEALARRSAVPVQLDFDVDLDVPERVEVAAYYVVAEALTNVAKHAQASVVAVCVDTETVALRILVRDNGVGGANTVDGSGLTGLIDRVESHGGMMSISSPIGSGTSLLVTIPTEAT